MKLQIRENVFETNSSSTHTISLRIGTCLVEPEDKTITIPNILFTENNDYLLSTPEERLAFLIFSSYRFKKDMEIIIDLIDKVGYKLDYSNFLKSHEEYFSNSDNREVNTYINLNQLIEDTYLFYLFVFGEETICTVQRDDNLSSKIFDSIREVNRFEPLHDFSQPEEWHNYAFNKDGSLCLDNDGIAWESYILNKDGYLHLEQYNRNHFIFKISQHYRSSLREDPKTGIFLPIKSKYIKQILDKTKTIELRKNIPDIEPGDYIILYETSPVKAVAGYCKLKKFIIMDKYKFWNEYSQFLGINEEKYHEYYKNKENAIGFELEDVIVIKNKIELYELKERLKDFTVPQSFSYVKNIIPFISR